MRKAIKWTLLGLAVALIALVASLPFALPPAVKSIAEAKLAEFGFPATVNLRLGYVWRKGPEVSGTLRLALKDAPWRVGVDFGAGFGEWRVDATLPSTAFSESEPTLRKLLERYPVKAVSNLVFSGSVAFEASARRTRKTPVPVWSVKVPVRRLSASATVGTQEFAVSELSVTPGASGIADHIDIAPMFPRICAASAAGLELTNLVASIRMTEKSLMVNEASAGFCGGTIRLYSVFLNPKNMDAGLTLFMEDINAGEALSLIKGIRAKATGLLQGKIRLFVKEGGKAIRLQDAGLHSTLGEIGKLRLENPEDVTDILSLAGLDNAMRGNVANALTDLDYSVLKLDLRRNAGDTATLSLRLDGTATRGGLSVPVNLAINVNGELEQLINTSLGYANLSKKGKQK